MWLSLSHSAVPWGKVTLQVINALTKSSQEAQPFLGVHALH